MSTSSPLFAFSRRTSTCLLMRRNPFSGLESQRFSRLANRETNPLKYKASNPLLHLSEVMKVASPISTEHTMLRCSILPNLLEILAINKHRDLPQRIFEVGPVVQNFKERYVLAAVSTHATANFAEVKSMVDAVLKEMGLDDAEVVDSNDGAFFEYGRRADIIKDGEYMGVFGELHPEVITNFGLDHPVVGFEVDVSSVEKE